MTPTFDILLCYYDNPRTLHNWLARLILQSDFLEFASLGNIIVADTGTPQEKVPETLAVLKKWSPYKKAIYVRVETDDIRSSLPPGVHARPTPRTYNVCTKEISSNELLIHSTVGHVFVPNYFAEVLPQHAAERRLFLQARQFRLHSREYHITYFDQRLDWALRAGQIVECGGLPDFSVRREHVLAIGGWDEDFVTWGMCDIDVCTRLTGMIERGIPAEQWHQQFAGTEKEPYRNYGLEFRRPHTPRLFSLICNDYPDHVPDADASRDQGIRRTMAQYLQKWGIVQRNPEPLPAAYQVNTSY